jgi:ubiquinone/menaquinone biosynthesis C-methylase UbiE
MQWLCTRRIRVVLAVSLSAVALTASGGWTQTAPQSTASKAKAKAKSKADPEINEPFKRPDVKEYIKRFETEDREIYAKRHEIVTALELRPGMAVADVGAGTGFLTQLVAEKVGPAGKVYAVDVATEFLTHIAAEAKKRGLTNVVTILGSQDSTNLPRESVDLVFLSDTYHHLENPQKALASIRQALRPGGSLVVIDFDRIEGRSTPFVLKHVRANQAVFRREIEAAGFTRVPASRPPRLKENFFLRFQKPDRTTRADHDPRDPRQFHSALGEAGACRPGAQRKTSQTSMNAWVSASRQDNPASSRALARWPQRSRHATGQPATTSRYARG